MTWLLLLDAIGLVVFSTEARTERNADAID